MRDAELGAEITPSEAAIAVAVIGEHAFDRDVVESEPAVGAFEEAGAAHGVFGVEDLAVSDSAVRIDGGVHVVVTERDSAVGDVAAAV